jgi:glycosyltransferase involved in cell wall biosynthesis
VDDGSPDRSGEICDEYALKDQRISVIHTPNRGASHARNTGLEHASGEYLFFVDSDDWVEENHIETLLPVDGEDLVYGGTKLFRNAVLFDVRTPNHYVALRDEWVLDYSDFLQRGLQIHFIHPCYRFSVIRDHNLRFNTTIHCDEDGTFNVTFLKYCRKVRYSATSTYCYEDGDDTSDSLSHRFRPNDISGKIVLSRAVEDMTGRTEYLVRWRCWQGILKHYKKWLTFRKGIHRKESKRAMKKAYKTEYFRESIPYMRKNGSLDQRVETYFMRYWLHPFYKPFYSGIVALSRVKRLIVRR